MEERVMARLLAKEDDLDDSFERCANASRAQRVSRILPRSFETMSFKQEIINFPRYKFTWEFTVSQFKIT